MRSRQRLYRRVIVVGPLFCVFLLSDADALGSSQPQIVDMFRPVPAASCGSQDRVESVQGETTLAERFRPGPSKAYTCNLRLVGQFRGEGSAFWWAAYKNWVYFSTWPNPGLEHSGVTVLDVSDSQHPRPTAYLNSPAMTNANESLAVSPLRALLLANNIASTVFDLYDLASDPGHPILISSASIPGMVSHSGEFSHDGRTFYGASCCPSPTTTVTGPGAPPLSAIFAIDVSQPAQPRGIATWIPESPDWQTHAVRVSEDGTRAYVTLARLADDFRRAPSSNGLVILDITNFNDRQVHPQFRLVSTLFWNDTHLGQYVLPVKINGRSYLVISDLVGSIGLETQQGMKRCDSGMPTYGFARIIEVGDEKTPKVVSKLMLKVDDPAICKEVLLDPVVEFGYGSSACDVDDKANARLLACGYFEGGLRVFDIRDPYQPTEIAYYKPAATRSISRPAAPNIPFLPGGKDHTADQVVAAQFRKNGEEIWFNSFDNGFQVVRFTDAFVSLHKQLFRH